MMGATAERRAKTLSTIEIFAGLNGQDLAALSAMMEEREFAAGQAVFTEGEAGDALYVVCSGQVAISVRSQDGEDIELSRMGCGDFFGEMAIIEKAPRSATCTALEPTHALALKVDGFEALILERPGLAVSVLERMLGIAATRLMSTGAFLSQMVQWGDAARKRAITDSATGLFNRRYLEDSLDSLVSQAKKQGQSISFAMFDLDRFGKLNASYGAEFCDRLIIDVASAFRRVFGEGDILVRYGGDEFCFILPGSSELSLPKCQALCQALRQLEFPEHPELRVSCSIGLADLPASAKDVGELKERADKALYLAKESGRDRAYYLGNPIDGSGPKREIPTIAAKRRVIDNIIQAMVERDSFVMLGHKDPDEDCVSSMVALALLVSKFNKKATIILGPSVQDNFAYLLSICRYNSIDILFDSDPPPCDALVLVDTAKPSMIDRGERYHALRMDERVVKIEIDHHLEADTRYFGQEGYSLILEASSTCEIVGYLAIKLAAKTEIVKRHHLGEILSRNIVLAIISGIMGDSRMGRYLKTRRERWFYNLFSRIFEELLTKKTLAGSGNFSSKEQVFDALAALSSDEEECFQFILAKARIGACGRIGLVALDRKDSKTLFSKYGNDIAVAVTKAVVDHLAESSKFLGLIGYYDDPEASPFAQFRLRRSQAYIELDLRQAIAELGFSNGGGHPGAVGFRTERENVEDMGACLDGIVKGLESMMDRQKA